jgi:hypothetical protein
LEEITSYVIAALFILIPMITVIVLKKWLLLSSFFIGLLFSIKIYTSPLNDPTELGAVVFLCFILMGLFIGVGMGLEVVYKRYKINS